MSAYPDQPNHDLLDRIPLDARVVMDVGCAGGALLAAYRRLNPRARLLGIDLDPDAAERAARRLDEVAQVDVERQPLPFATPDGIDCIIYGDVLEHLREPWRLLRRQLDALSPDGMVLICVPNVEHWSFAARLLAGTWAYEPEGLFDSTHLRWFSLETMRQGLTELGLVLCDVHPRVFQPEHGQQFIAAAAPLLRALDVDPARYAGRALPLQYVWRVRRRPLQRLTIAASMLQPVGGVSHVRVLHPLQALASDPAVVQHYALPEEPPTVVGEEPRIFILHRPALRGRHGIATIERLLAQGWLMVTEFDDHPDFFPALRGSGSLTFGGVHAVQTSTPALAEVLRARNPEVAVFANAVRGLPDVRNFTDPERLTLFFGALNRERDWQPLMPTLNEVAAAAGGRLHFQVVHDRGFFDALDTPHKAFTPTCDYDTYCDLLGRCEVSLMPLLDTPFNRTKSDLKFIEAAACRVVSLASRLVYDASIDDGRTGLLFDTAEDLRARLLRLIVMPETARAIGDAARLHVAQHRMLAYQVAPRLAWYRSLWARRQPLTDALRARLAALTALDEAPAA